MGARPFIEEHNHCRQLQPSREGPEEWIAQTLFSFSSDLLQVPPTSRIQPGARPPVAWLRLAVKFSLLGIEQIGEEWIVDLQGQKEVTQGYIFNAWQSRVSQALSCRSGACPGPSMPCHITVKDSFNFWPWVLAKNWVLECYSLFPPPCIPFHYIALSFH